MSEALEAGTVEMAGIITLHPDVHLYTDVSTNVNIILSIN